MNIEDENSIFDFRYQDLEAKDRQRKEDELWEKIFAEASEFADNPSFDYGVPYSAFHDFLDNIRKEYSLIKRGF